MTIILINYKNDKALKILRFWNFIRILNKTINIYMKRSRWAIFLTVLRQYVAHSGLSHLNALYSFLLEKEDFDKWLASNEHWTIYICRFNGSRPFFGLLVYYFRDFSTQTEEKLKQMVFHSKPPHLFGPN